MRPQSAGRWAGSAPFPADHLAPSTPNTTALREAVWQPGIAGPQPWPQSPCQRRRCGDPLLSFMLRSCGQRSAQPPALPSATTSPAPDAGQKARVESRTWERFSFRPWAIANRPVQAAQPRLFAALQSQQPPPALAWLRVDLELAAAARPACWWWMSS